MRKFSSTGNFVHATVFENLQFQLSKFILDSFTTSLPFEFHKSSWKSVTHESFYAISKSTPCSFSILIQIVERKTNRKPLRIWQFKRIKICFSFSLQSDRCCLKWENGFGVFNRFVISPDASKAGTKDLWALFFVSNVRAFAKLSFNVFYKKNFFLCLHKKFSLAKNVTKNEKIGLKTSGIFAHCFRHPMQVFCCWRKYKPV